MSERKAYLKRAELTDKNLLLAWANEEDVRKNSFNHDGIAYEEHEKWFMDKLKDENCLLYIYIYNTIPVGQIRVDMDGTHGMINYSIDRNYRSQGHGGKMLILLEEILSQEKPTIKYLCAKVLKSNIASQKKFEQQNYQKFEKDTHIEYIKISDLEEE